MDKSDVKGLYVLLLVYVDNDLLDIGGNLYPKEGYVESNEFSKDIDIRYGLYGIMFGKTNKLQYENINSGHWIVVKTELNEYIIKTDRCLNRYKFNNGFVVHFGNLESASEYIIDNKNNDCFMSSAKNIKSEEIAGSKKWMKKNIRKENICLT
jgi:hypothetical protein